MFVALELLIQFLSAVLPAVICALVRVGHDPAGTGSKFVPLAFLRFRLVRRHRSAAVIRSCPFLFCQNPGVRPPPAPRQTLPKLTTCGQPELLMLTACDFAVVFCQDEAANTSVTVELPADRPMKVVLPLASVNWVADAAPLNTNFQPPMFGSPPSCDPFVFAS